MQNNAIIDYHKDDYYMISDPSFKAERFIGKVNSINIDGVVTLNIYIFPEDTKEGRQMYMSYYEIFLTKNEMAYQFSGNEIQVNVTDLPNFIKRKYIQKEDLSIRQLYFQRQKYLENGKFEPTLEKICYCQQYFNPDYIFKTCNCGSFFHPICFMKSETNKCWNKNCNIDCSIFFSPEEMFDKKKKISQSQIQSALPLPHNKPTNKPNSPKKHSVLMREDFFGEERKQKENNNIKSDIITLEEFSKFDTTELFKKGKKKNNNITNDKNIPQTKLIYEEKEKEIKIKQEPFINIGIKSEKGVVSPTKATKIFDTTIYEKKPGGGYQVQIKSEANIIEDAKKKTEADREKARKIIYDNLINGIKYLQKNTKILDDFEKEKLNLKSQISLIKENNTSNIDTHYKELANSIENNLFKNCEQKTQGSYFFSFLQEFALLLKDSKKILFRVILGDLTSEEISKFKGDDFLPEEKRKAKEELKKKEIERMKFKGPMKILAISNKGRMLTEIQDIIDVNKNTFSLDTQIPSNSENSSNLSEYYEKVKIMKEKYPNMFENDIKFLVEMKEPNEEQIQNRLNDIIQETLNLEEQRELFSYREKTLQKKAERHYKKISNTTDKALLGKKIKDYIQSISFDFKLY